MSKVRIGFVGAGSMGQTAHLQNFASNPDCEIVALAEGREKTARLVAERYHIPEVYSNHVAMLESAQLDAVVAIMDYRLHASVVPDILNAGLHVLTEKPICVSVNSARKMAALAEERGLIYMLGYMKRSLPATLEAVAQIQAWKDSGEAGEMNYLRASMPPGDWVFGVQWGINAGDSAPDYPGVKPEAFPEWMKPEEQDRYNAFINYYIHQINLIRYLIGEDYKATFVDRNEAVMAFESESGVTGILEMKGRGLHKSWEEFYLLSFDNGRVDLSVPAPMAQQNGGDVRFYWGGDGIALPRWEHPVMPPLWSMRAQAAHFIECVKDGQFPRSPASEGVKDLEVAEQYIQLLGRW